MSSKDVLLQKIKEARKSKDVQTLLNLAKEAEQSGFFDINFYILGLVNRIQKNFSLAIEYFNKALEIDPKNLMILLSLGGCYLDTGKYEESIKTYVDYLNSGGNKAVYYYNVALAYKLSGRYEESIAAFLQAEELEPKLIGVYYHISQVSLKLGNMDIFKHYVEKAYDKFKDDAEKKDLLSKLFKDIAKYCVENQKLDLAIDCCDKSLNIKNTWNPHLIKAICYLSLKEYDKAIVESRYAIELNNQVGFSYYAMADAFILKNDPIQAFENLKNAIRLDVGLLDILKKDEDFKFLLIPKEATSDEALKILEEKINIAHNNMV